MKMSKSMLMAAVICSSFGMLASAYAAEAKSGDNLSEFYLDQLVVTANRKEQTNFDSHANVNVVTRKNIEDNHFQTVSEALRTVPGVTIQNYSATGANYSADGLYINGTSHVIVLIDGQRANTNGSVSSVFQPSEISNMDMIERIEVLKGSASTLYGSDAVGGVINIITRKPKEGYVSTKIGITAGNYEKKTFDLYHQGMSAKGLYWSFGGQRDKINDYKDGDGNRTIGEVDSKSFNVKIGQKFDDKADINLSYTRYKSDYARPNTDGMSGTFTGERATGKKDNEKWAANFDYQFNDALSNRLSFFSRTSDLDDNINHPANLWLMREKTWGFSDQVTYEKGNHTVIAGFDFYKDSMNKYIDMYTPNMTGSVSNKAFFVQDTMQFGLLTVTPGVRISNHSEFGNNTSASGVIAYDINDNANVYVSYKQFFRSPYLYELYNPFYGSEKLNPEKGNTVELGTNLRLGSKTTAAAHVFRTNSDNLIGFNMETWKYYNAGEEKINGWDIQVHHQFTKEISLNAAYTHIDIDPASPAKNSNRDGAIPRGTYDVTLNYDTDKFNANINTKGIMNRPGRKIKAASVSDSFKSYWIFNAAINYRPVKEMNVFLRANNIFDKMYTDMTYDMTNPGGAGWYSQPGRNFVIGVEYTF